MDKDKKLTVEITDSNGNVRDIVTKQGQNMRFFEQTAYIHLGARYPKEFKLSSVIKSGDIPQPLAPGHYTIDFVESLQVDRYSKLTLGDLRLVPVIQDAKRALADK